MVNRQDDDDKQMKDYAEEYDDSFRLRPRLRSLMSRGSVPVFVDVQDPETGEWRKIVKMSRKKMTEAAKQAFLDEYVKWGRMGESAAAAGVGPGTVRKALEEDEEFAEAMMLCEEAYRDKLISHHQNLIYNGVEKENYDRMGNLVSKEIQYPIPLIQMELKRHFKEYRDKQEVAVTHTGGVLVAPAEMNDIGDWEKRFGAMKDITPATTDTMRVIGTEEEED